MQAQRVFLAHRFLEDWGYQTLDAAGSAGRSRSGLGTPRAGPGQPGGAGALCAFIEGRLAERLAELQARGIGEGLELTPGSVRLPWRRTFEVDFEPGLRCEANRKRGVGARFIAPFLLPGRKEQVHCHSFGGCARSGLRSTINTSLRPAAPFGARTWVYTVRQRKQHTMTQETTHFDTRRPVGGTRRRGRPRRPVRGPRGRRQPADGDRRHLVGGRRGPDDLARRRARRRPRPWNSPTELACPRPGRARPGNRSGRPARLGGRPAADHPGRPGRGAGRADRAGPGPPRRVGLVGDAGHYQRPAGRAGRRAGPSTSCTPTRRCTPAFPAGRW